MSIYIKNKRQVTNQMPKIQQKSNIANNNNTKTVFEHQSAF